MGSTKVSQPEVTPQEQQLQAAQVNLLTQQRDLLTEQVRQQNLLAPILFKNAGITPQYDDSGKIIGFTQPQDELAPLRSQIEKSLLERTQNALTGNLPVDPTITRELGQQEATLRETLRKQLGPGYDVSTPGVQALNDFGQSRAGIIGAASRGDLTTSEALSLARQGQQEQTLNNLISRIAGINQFGQASALTLGQAANSDQQTLNYLLGNRQLGLAANQASQQARIAQLTGIIGGSSSSLGGILGGAGQGIGSYAGLAALAAA